MNHFGHPKALEDARGRRCVWRSHNIRPGRAENDSVEPRAGTALIRLAVHGLRVVRGNRLLRRPSRRRATSRQLEDRGLDVHAHATTDYLATSVNRWPSGSAAARVRVRPHPQGQRSRNCANGWLGWDAAGVRRQVIFHFTGSRTLADEPLRRSAARRRMRV